MAARSELLSQNYRLVLDRIRAAGEAAGRQALPRLVAVSKYMDVEDIQHVYDLGHRHFGENYTQELAAKVKRLPEDINWHYIGTLQTSKCKQLAQMPNLWAVETVESIKKADAMNRAVREGCGRLRVYLQVNTSGEAEKSGMRIEEVYDAVRHVDEQCTNLELVGLMTIGSLSASTSTESSNPDFEELVKVRDDLRERSGLMLELSMGMSHDFELATKMGADSVRVGSLIFGARKPKQAD